ncbi:hypothetical protein QR680_018447 [Steinernema hermaphroditum]|uniref:Phosphatidylcholine transfer protein n=1 Tax=Steinernema hermaphroditum TaxID=289476 RepID=A0AA39LQS1_9BILA|nr:hypothetical protein QR680_018447 [Steinernema hermaphroditum]
MPTSAMENSEHFASVFSTCSQQQAALKAEERSSVTVFENVQPDEEIVGFTNEQIREWLYGGGSPFSKTITGPRLASRSRSISLGSERMRNQMPSSKSDEEVGATSDEIKRSILGGKLPRVDPKQWKLTEKNTKFFIGSASRQEAEEELQTLGTASFLLYEEAPDVLVFLYFSQRRFFHRFPVRRCRIVRPRVEQTEWWSSRENFALFPRDALFEDLNDLIDFYAGAIADGKNKDTTVDPFQKACAEFEGLESCKIYKMIHGRCCGGRFHKNVRRNQKWTTLAMRLYWRLLTNFVRNYRKIVARRYHSSHTFFGLRLHVARPTAMLMFSSGLSLRQVECRSPTPANETLDCEEDFEGWEPMVQEEYLRVYRRKINAATNIYEYRCEGTYFDITPRSFIDAQNNVEYRRKWDSNVISLEILNSHPQSGTQVIRWIAKFPFPMYAREYVYFRQQLVDHDNKTIMVTNRALDEADYPASKMYVRVKLYRSSLVVRAHVDFDQSGFDYTLTYCDNPEANIPSTAYNWIVNQGGPIFLNQVYNAAKDLEMTRPRVEYHQGVRSSSETVLSGEEEELCQQT